MKRRVSIEGMFVGEGVAHANVVVFETQTIEGQKQEVPLGEATITFPGNLPKEEMVAKVKEAGKKIEDEADKAKALRTELNELIAKGGLK